MYSRSFFVTFVSQSFLRSFHFSLQPRAKKRRNQDKAATDNDLPKLLSRPLATRPRISSRSRKTWLFVRCSLCVTSGSNERWKGQKCLSTELNQIRDDAKVSRNRSKTGSTTLNWKRCGTGWNFHLYRLHCVVLFFTLHLDAVKGNKT